MKYDLNDVTFIVPLRIDTDDRLRNIILTTSFLLTHFECTIIIKESDSEKKFEQWALPQIREYVDTTDLNYVFEQNDDDHFHRTRLLNDMVMMAETDIVVNYDSDIVLPISSYVEAVEKLRSGECDVVYPYKFGQYGEKKVVLKTRIEDEDDLENFSKQNGVKDFVKGFDPGVFDKSFFYAENVNGPGWAEYGMVQFFKTSIYKDGFLENEGFMAYAPEDVERHHRWKTLGYNIGRVDRHAYHLEHKRTPNSWFNNPFMQHNNNLWERLREMSRSELIEYYRTQPYVRERLK